MVHSEKGKDYLFSLLHACLMTIVIIIIIIIMIQQTILTTHVCEEQALLLYTHTDINKAEALFTG